MIIKYSPNKKNLHNEIRDGIREDGAVILKNFMSPVKMKKIFNHVKKSFLNQKDIKRSGRFIYLQKDYKRLDIGDSYINSRVNRFLLYNEWNKKNFDLFQNIKDVIELRNLICNMKKKKYQYNLNGRSSSKYKWCDLVRMIQYPIGGGFLSLHTDENYKIFPKQMINVLIPLAKRTTKKYFFPTYETGGLYYLKKDRKKIDAEKNIDVGDVLFHDLVNYHGVNSIDPDKNFELNAFSGRMTLNISVGKFYIK